MAKNDDSGATGGSAPDAKPGRKSGYAEPQPRDGSDARQPYPRKPQHPDAGGLDREPVPSPDTADGD